MYTHTHTTMILKSGFPFYHYYIYTHTNNVKHQLNTKFTVKKIKINICVEGLASN